MRTEKVYSQPITRKKWSVVKGGFFESFIFKVTFGKFGRLEYLTVSEEKMHVYFIGGYGYAGAPPKMSGENNIPPRPMNCRSKTVSL